MIAADTFDTIPSLFMKEKNERGRAGSLVAKHTTCNHEIVGSTPTPPAKTDD